MVDTLATSTVPEAQIQSAVQKVCDLTPGGIITTLDLLTPIYRYTAAYGGILGGVSPVGRRLIG